MTEKMIMGWVVEKNNERLAEFPTVQDAISYKVICGDWQTRIRQTLINCKQGKVEVKP